MNMGYQLLSVVKRACDGGSKGCLGREDEVVLGYLYPKESLLSALNSFAKTPGSAPWRRLGRSPAVRLTLVSFIFNLHQIREELKDKGEGNVVVAYYLDGPNQPDRHCV